MGQDKDRESSLSSYCHGQNGSDYWRSSLIYYHSNHSRRMRNKPKSSKHLPLTPPFFLGLTLLPVFSCCPTMARGCWEWGLQSVYHTSALLLPPLLPSGGEFLTLFSVLCGIFHWLQVKIYPAVTPSWLQGCPGFAQERVNFL